MTTDANSRGACRVSGWRICHLLHGLLVIRCHNYVSYKQIHVICYLTIC